MKCREGEGRVGKSIPSGCSKVPVIDSWTREGGRWSSG